MTTEHPEDRSVADLIRELRDETMMLMRQEIALAKTETSEKVSRVTRNLAYLGTGGLVLYAGLIFILLALTAIVGIGLAAAGVSDAVNVWLAPLIVGVVVGIVGYGFVQKAISTLRHESIVPEKTVRSLKEDKEWAQERLR